MIKQNYEVEILVNGKPLKEFYKDSKHFIEGRRGTEFSLRFRNNGSKRALFVPTVDGLSIMNGKTGSYDSSGYIINGYDSLTIDGWRISDKQVKRFFFTDPENSYAERSDKGGNLGVIGLAVFREKENELDLLKDEVERLKRQQPVIIHHHPKSCWSRHCINCSHYHCTCEPCRHFGAFGGTFYTTDNAKVFTLSASNTSANMNVNNSVTLDSVDVSEYKGTSQKVGTGFGEVKWSEVKTVSFEREKTPDAVFEIYYNTKEELEKLGIDFNSKPVYVAPQAFPNQYCEEPKR